MLKTVNQAIEDLIKNGVISSDAATRFTSDRNVESPELGEAKGDPVFLCILIDASGSMKVCKDAVVESHPIMLDALRGSALARNNLLFVCQYLFNSSPTNLHPFTPLAPVQGNDQVTVLNVANYNPNDRTALYKTMQFALQDLLVILSCALQEGLSPSCSIALITDGEDTEGEVTPSEIKNLFQELQNKKILKSSVLVGLLNSNLTIDNLESMQKTLGFKTLIDCGQNPAREIRSALRYRATPYVEDDL